MGLVTVINVQADYKNPSPTPPLTVGYAYTVLPKIVDSRRIKNQHRLSLNQWIW